MPREWYRSLPASGLACLLVIALWMWRSDTASGLERAWVGMMTIAAGFGLWGLARAFQTSGWVGDEEARHPALDYSSARSVAQTHSVTHGCLLLTTLALLAFGLVAALTAPAHPTAPPTRTSYALTAALLLVGLTKTFLNIYLVYKRDRLVQVVSAIGGD